MKYFVVGDVHGFYDEMVAALDKAGFNRNDENHTLISLGDNFDRGPKSKEVLKFLWDLPRKVLIRGNHEDLLVECLNSHMYYSHDVQNKTVDTIAQFANLPVNVTKMIFDEACQKAEGSGVRYFIEKMMVNYFETNKYVFVHGWIPAFKEYRDLMTITEYLYSYMMNWRERAGLKDWQEARWSSGLEMYGQKILEPNKTIVCGHWNTLSFNLKYANKMSNEIFYGEGCIAIDGSTAGTGLVNVLVIED